MSESLHVTNPAVGYKMPKERPPYGPALAVRTNLFFIGGFTTVSNNTLLPHLRAAFARD